MKFTKLNELQIPTWRWLHLNSSELEVETELDIPYQGGVISAEESMIKIEKYVAAPALDNIPDDVKRMYEFVLKNNNYGLTVTIPTGIKMTEPIILEFELDDTSPVLIDFLHIKAEAGSYADIIVNYRATGKEPHFHNGFACLQVAKDSQVRLIKAQMLGENDTHIDNNAVQVEANGQGDLIFCELGSGQISAGCNIVLSGAESRSELQSLYLGDRERKLDFNYRMELRGKESDGKILVRGALAGEAKKTLKSNLDFIRGASGSKGSEEEIVLTLSDRAINLSVPLLLCGEDNVEGSHATSSGKPSASKLFYLMSRGLSEKEAKHLLVEASFTPILAKLSSNELKDIVKERIREVLG
ncbi:MAG: SufBD protein [Herbinix sp.]|jgi:Fe-S cluster assembly scaffold protein SufB|nr:SufBD protein [Herbinix sp.]